MKFRILLFITALLSVGTVDAQNYGATEEEQLLCKEALSLYRTYRDQEQWHDAYQFWQKARTACPDDVTERIYSDGIKFIGKEIKLAEGTPRKEVLVDSLLLVFDERIAAYPGLEKTPAGHCNITGMKALSLLKYRKDQVDTAFVWLETAVGCMQENSRSNYLSNYYLLIHKKMTRSEGEAKASFKERLLLEYLVLQDYCDYGIANASTDRKKIGFEKAKSNIDEIFVLVADCETMMPILQAKIEEAPEDVEMYKKVLKLMNKKDCTDSEFYLNVAQKVCEAESSSDCNYALGIGYMRKSDLRTGLEYLETAIELCPDCVDRENYLLKAGQAASALGMSRKAIKYAKDVLTINPNSGEAWMLQGDAVAGSASTCDADGLGGRSVYWLAVDKYAKAKSLDPSLSSKISKKISTCAGQYPTRTDLFQRTLKEGQAFEVACWGETTSIRERK
ncbi:MAG: tetratricopeptide (TPR) repeat protein [Flavobacteriales bacterium]|jgi:tetratricopeptide (TPR) repeat protein